MSEYTWIKSNGCSELYPFSSAWDPWILFQEWADSVFMKYKIIWEKELLQDANKTHFFLLKTCQNLGSSFDKTTDTHTKDNGSDDTGEDMDEVTGEGLKILLKRLDQTAHKFKEEQWGSISTYAILKYFKYRSARFPQQYQQHSSSSLTPEQKVNKMEGHISIESQLQLLEEKEEDSDSLNTISLDNEPESITTITVNSIAYSLGNLFFGYWRENKEYISTEKFNSLLKLHMTFLELALIKKDDVNVLLMHQSQSLESIYTAKVRESVQHLILRGSVLDCIHSHDVCLWARLELDRLQLCIEAMWNLDTTLTCEMNTCKIKLIGVQNPRTLDKKLKNEIKNVLIISSLEHVTLKIADTQEWCEKLHQRLAQLCSSQKQIKLVSFADSEPLVAKKSLHSTTTSTTNASSFFAKSSTLLDKMSYYLKTTRAKFKELDRLDVYDRVCSWWQEGLLQDID